MHINNVDPDLRAATKALPALDWSNAFIRNMARWATAVMPVRRVAGVAVSTAKLGELRLRIYVPDLRRNEAALLWIHGGGLMFGDARQDEPLCAETARDLGMVVVSANYRFAPEHPFPAALDDVHWAWRWLQLNADELGVNPARIVLGGESAGGGLAAVLAQRLLDEGGSQPIGQWLFSPMIDDRTAADETLDSVEHWAWNNRSNRNSWRGYLGKEPGGEEVPRYAAAARRENLTGLPPSFLAVGDIELFFPEVREYGRRLASAGVRVTLDVVPNAPHGFESWARNTKPAKALMGRARQWLAVVVGSGTLES
ncbi:alpha/beta hydrolase [Pseudarthrobacter sp. J1738]|uniref:alpha/beta hydrolase n=1 Tax=Pseudarthrobacter sp. J1738 TaxID=3420446 RepID=UPI003D2CAB05